MSVTVGLRGMSMQKSAVSAECTRQLPLSRRHRSTLPSLINRGNGTASQILGRALRTVQDGPAAGGAPPSLPRSSLLAHHAELVDGAKSRSRKTAIGSF